MAFWNRKTQAVAQIDPRLTAAARAHTARMLRGSVNLTRAYDTLRDRLNSDWKLNDTTANDDIYAALREYRNAARSLTQNNDYAARYLGLAALNIVGKDGFTLKNEAAEFNPTTKLYAPDTLANTLIEEAWAEFGKRGNCTADGRFSLREVEQLAVKTCARDGEAFIRLVRGDSLPFGIGVQIIDSTLVDEMLNVEVKGLRIIMGVEVDDWGRPLAYYLRKRSGILPQTTAPTKESHLRVPATQMIHLYRSEFATQTRAVTWYAPVIKAMRHLGAFEEAALVNARASAAKMGFIEKESPDAAQYTGQENDEDGNIISHFSAGEIEELDFGQKITFHDPTFPSGDYPDYIKSQLRRIAAGLGVSYSSLTGDLSDVNYSSIRAGLVEERQAWANLQSWYSEQFLNPLFEAWLRSTLEKQKINLPAAKFDKFNSPRFIGRSWDWVDPKSDAEADQLAVDSGFKTRSEVLAARGKDYEEHLMRMKADKELEAKYGIEYGPSAPPPQPQAANDTETEDEQAEAE